MIASPDPHSLAVSQLILEVFRLNGRLLAAGDALVAPLGLTSARWQVMGAIALAAEPGTVARLARSMGMSRQGVQRVVNELAAEGLVQFTDNPNHRRAKLVRFTAEGQARFAAAQRLQRPWVDALAEAVEPDKVAAANTVLATLSRKLEAAGEDD